MEIIKVKIKDKKTGTIYEVKKTLVNDYVGTGDFELVKDEIIPKLEKSSNKKSTFFKSDK